MIGIRHSSLADSDIKYQVRVVLCAYMILGHPDGVFSGQGERETVLAESAVVSDLQILNTGRSILQSLNQWFLPDVVGRYPNY
ncbi:putative T-complex 11 protein [Helianthus annuus]|uniref:T-complex 11 protein n=1 Tax=Helianthus annuus TaxID=4232 RepID=A0A9K3HZY2_HELAN|nr:putative T-complex 11 protein [Helianthus annuus]KAJ0880678.1 putative T-complex 11 protein [Helianthus annuus]